MATLTTTPIKVFVSGETVTPTKLNELSQSTVALTAGTIVDADISASAAIAASKLSTAAQQALLPAGAVMPFAMNSAPSGWLAADGTAVSRSTYATLFAAIGTTYGAGDGSTTFALPDMRGYFVRGSGTNSDATASGAFGTKQAHAFLNHSHSASSDTQGAHTHTYDRAYNAGAVAAPGNLGHFYLNQSATTSSAGSHSHTITVNTSTAGGTETRPANIALLYCIKF